MSANRVKIKVYLNNVVCCFSYCQHLSAVVTNLDSNEKFAIDFPIIKKPAKYHTNIELQTESDSEHCTRSVTVYSNEKNFDEFLAKYHKEFDTDCSSAKTCADAVKSALDYFCADRSKEFENFCTAYKILCCLPHFLTLGLKCFPSLLCTAPADVFDLAYALSMTKYGKYPEQMEYKPLPTAATESHRDKESAQALPKLSVLITVQPKEVVQPTQPLLPTHLRM